MSKNRTMLKEAIADAKTIKAAAITNAKLALEETFTPHVKEMLSAKIQEMEDEDNEEIEKPNLDEVEDKEEIEEKKDESEDETEEEIDIENMSEDDLVNQIKSVIDSMVTNGELEAGENSSVETEENSEDEAIEKGEEAKENEDEGSIDELLKELESEDVTSENKDVTESEIVKEYEDYEAYEREFCQAHPDNDFCKSMNEAKVKSEMKKEKSVDESKIQTELDEAYKAIESMKKDINEVNLLNAKLLYANKIFRTKTLTEVQKIKVLGAFDKVSTVKEAKLVYDTLTEGLKTQIKSPIREHLGSASKSITKVITKQPIIETNDMVSRFQKLAGINKK